MLPKKLLLDYYDCNLVVNGFIREYVKNVLNTDALVLSVVPNIVKCEILKYYYIVDRFGTQNKGQFMFEDDGKIAIDCRGWFTKRAWNTVFGQQIISHLSTYIVKLKMVQKSDISSVSIGIIDDNEVRNYINTSNSQRESQPPAYYFHSYGYQSLGYCYHKHKIQYFKVKNQENNQKESQTILNFSKDDLKENQEVLCYSDDTKYYHPAIILARRHLINEDKEFCIIKWIGYSDQFNMTLNEDEYKDRIKLINTNYSRIKINQNDIISIKCSFPSNTTYGILSFKINDGPFYDTYQISKHKVYRMYISSRKRGNKFEIIY